MAAAATDFEKTGACELCGTEGPTALAFMHHPDKETRRREDYRELCPVCADLIERELRCSQPLHPEMRGCHIFNVRRHRKRVGLL